MTERVDLRGGAAAAGAGCRAAAAAGRGTGPGARTRRPGGRAARSPTSAPPSEALARATSADARSRASAPTRPTTAGPYVDHSRDIGAYNPCFPEYDDRRRRRPRDGHGHVPARVRRPARRRARRRARDVLRLRRPAPQLRRRRGRQDHLAARRVPAADPARRRRCSSRSTATTDERRITSRARDCSAATTRCAPRRWRRWPATAAGCRPSRRGGRRRERRRRRRRRRPAAHRARAAARAGGRAGRPSAADLRRRRAVVRRRRRRGPRRWRKGLLAVGAGPGHARRAAPPERIGVRRRAGWPRRASARSPSRSAPSRPAPSCACCCATPTSRCCFATTSFRGRDYVDALRDAVPGLDFARRTAAAHGGDAGAAPDRVRRGRARRRVANGRPTRSWPRAPRSTTTCSRRPRRSVSPADRMVIVHTSGSTSDPKGVIHQHGPLIRHLDNLNALRRYAEHEVLFSNSPFFWIGGFAYGLLGTLLAGATLVCSNATDTGATLDLLERARPTMVNGFAASVAHLAQGPDVPDPRPVARSGAATSGRSCPPRVRAARSRAAPQHARHDRGRQRLPRERRRDRPARAPPRVVRSAGAGLRGEDRRPRHRRRARRRRGRRAVAAEPVPHGGLLRPRAPRDVHARRLVPHRRPVPRRRRRLLLLHRPPRRHDQDGGRERLAARGRSRDRRRRPAWSRTSSASTIRSAGSSSPRRSGCRAGQEPPDADALRAELRTRLSAYKVPQRYLVLADDDVPMLSSGKLDARALKERFREHADADCTLPGAAARATATRTAPSRRSSPPTARSPTPSSTPRAARSRRGSWPRASARARASACCMPNGIEWAVIAAAVARIGGVLVPLSTLLRPPELARAAAGRRRHPPRGRARVPRAVVPRRPRGGRARSRRRRREPVVAIRTLPALRAVWLADELPDAAVDDALVAALEDRVQPGRRPGRAVHVGQPRRAEGRRSTPTAARCAPSRPGSTRVASAPTIASTSRCRSSGPAGSRAVCSARSSRARRC